MSEDIVFNVSDVGCTVLTWNIDGPDEMHRAERTNAVIETIKSRAVDVVLLQELVPETYKQLLNELSHTYRFHSPLDTAVNCELPSNFCLLLLKRGVQAWDHCLEFYPSSPTKRHIISCKASLAGVSTYLFATQLESSLTYFAVRNRYLRPGEERDVEKGGRVYPFHDKQTNFVYNLDPDLFQQLPRSLLFATHDRKEFSTSKFHRRIQLRECFQRLSKIPKTETAILAGDFNVEDAEMKKYGPLPTGVEDCWEHCGMPRAAAYTWNMERNDNLRILTHSGPKIPKMRFDRVFLRPVPEISLKPVSLELVGTGRLPQVCYPSDHFGVLVKFVRFVFKAYKSLCRQ